MSKPTAEDEYFAREDAEKLRKLATEQRRGLAESEQQSLKALHHNRCPHCGMAMNEVSWRGVKVLRCFSCNGTFLASSELDKVVHAEPHGLMSDVLRIFEHKKTP